MINFHQDPDSNILHVELTGKLHDEDYHYFVPAVDAAVKIHGKVRILLKFQDFHGWDAHALWDDIQFTTTHCTAIERLAMVGETKWEEWMAKVCKPFTTAKVKYFDANALEAAAVWLKEEDLPEPGEGQ